MSNINNVDISKISVQLDAFYTALSCFIYYSYISENKNAFSSATNFWDLTEFIYLLTLLENWNKTFGLDCKNNHWKEITFEVPEYTKLFYEAGNFNYTSWTEYRAYVNELTHDFALFPDPYHHINQKYNLDGAKSSLEFTHDWLHELLFVKKKVKNIEELNKWPISNKDHIESLKKEIQSVLQSKI